MSRIRFTSVLHGSYQDALEQLFFFNKNQAVVRNAILSTVEEYGTPRISLLGNRLRVTFDSGLEPQTLFALEQIETNAQLVGVVVYTRKGRSLVVLFVAVREDYTLRGVCASEMLLFRIFEQLRNIASRVKGIDSLTLFSPAKVDIEFKIKEAVDDCR